MMKIIANNKGLWDTLYIPGKKLAALLESTVFHPNLWIRQEKKKLYRPFSSLDHLVYFEISKDLRLFSLFCLVKILPVLFLMH